MLVALKVRERRKEEEKALQRRNPEDIRTSDDAMHARPASFGETMAAMFKLRENWGLAILFLWGIVGGILSVGVTVLMQLGIVKS